MPAQLGKRDQPADALGCRFAAAPAGAPHLDAHGGAAARDLAADRAEPDQHQARARHLAIGVALPLMGLLHRQQPRHLAKEVEQPEDGELGQRAGMDAGGGGEGDVRLDQPGVGEELADAGAGALHPAQPRRVLRQVGRIEPVEIEHHLGLGQDVEPASPLCRRQRARDAVMVGDVARHRQQARLVQHAQPARDRRLDALRQFGLERRADDDGEGTVDGFLGHEWPRVSE